MKKLFSFLAHSFSDARGEPDGKLLTVAAVAFVVVLTYPVGWIWHVWPPEYIHSPMLLFLAAGLGLDAYVTHTKIRAEADVAQAEVTGVPTPTNPAAESNSLTVNTTITDSSATSAPCS